MNIVHTDKKGNKIVGFYPVNYNSSIVFEGENNVLYCEEGVELLRSRLTFHGNNSLIYLGTSQHRIEVDIDYDSVCHIGRNTYTDAVRFLIYEQKHCFVGSHVMFSYGITIRNADSHLIYSCDDFNRINEAKSVYIGDHVWIGQDAKVLKGTWIDSGSIVGTGSTVTGKRIPHNSIWAGNPAKQIKENIFWDKTWVRKFTPERTNSSKNYREFIAQNRSGFHDDYWIYEYCSEQEVKWEELDVILSTGTALQKCEFLIQLNDGERYGKNRFVHHF